MKKTESMTIRITEELKKKLQDIAKERKWTLSQTASIILEESCEAWKKSDSSF